MQIRLRGIEPGEARKWLEVTETSFGAGLPDDVFEDLRHVVETSRSIGAFEGDTMVGTAGAFSLQLTVPGGETGCAGVTMVGVVPTHRRRGVMTAMMIQQLREVAEKGDEPLAALWASEDSIYGRFGYGAATVQALIDVPRHRARFLNDGPIEGSLRLVDQDEAIAAFPAVYDAVRARTPGMFRRSEKWWRHRVARNPTRDEDGPFFRALLERDGRREAYAIYRVHQRWEKGVSRGNVELREVMVATPDAQREIWKFVFGIDLVESVRSTGFFLPSDHPLLLMLAEPRYLSFLLSNGLWLRVVDVAAALGARGYAGDGTVTLEVHDTLLEANSGTWRLDVDGGRAEVTKVAGDGDVRLGVAELGALYLGQFTFGQMLDAGRIEGSAQAVSRADELWRTPNAPWCPEIF